MRETKMPWCLLGFIFHLGVNTISRSHAFLSNITFFKKEEVLTFFHEKTIGLHFR